MHNYLFATPEPRLCGDDHSLLLNDGLERFHRQVMPSREERLVQMSGKFENKCQGSLESRVASGTQSSEQFTDVYHTLLFQEVPSPSVRGSSGMIHNIRGAVAHSLN